MQRLVDQGVSISWDLIASQTSGAIGRPHIARALIGRGYASNVSDAFSRWIGMDRPAYLPSPSLSPAQAVELAHSAGGEVGLAHPMRGSSRRPISAIPALIEAGVTGLETHYTEHSTEDVARLCAVAERHGLWWCGGSDFHGTNKPQIQLGCVDVPTSVLEQGPFRAMAGD